MADVRSAALYARISSDQEGTGLGVERQLEDCRAAAARLGWPIGDEYVDNDISATTGRKKRPEYERMLADLGDGLRDAVVAYHQDRLTRNQLELERFLELAAVAHVTHVHFTSGLAVDIANGDGLMMMRITGAVAANESATKSRRMRRKALQTAEKGLPHLGSNRPFGFEEDRITIRPDEAAVYRTLVARFVAGESLRSLVVWLNDQGVLTVRGNPWQTPALRQRLLSPRYAGLREYDGEVIAKAVWDPIITVEDRQRVLARFDAMRVSGRRAARRYVLSGLVRCGVCGNTLFSSARQGNRRYVCMSGPDHGGCGHIYVTAPPLEELITDAVLYRLDTPELADALAGRAAADAQTATLGVQLESDREQLNELAAMYAAKQIRAAEWMTARNPIETRIRTLERRLAQATSSHALTGLVGHGEALRAQWSGLNLDQQTAIVKAVLDYVVISRGTSPGSREFDPSRADPHWRI